MSGVLITLGFYGLTRFLPVLGPIPQSWAIALMGFGALGACGGIAMALSQSDVKRILAYSTIENAGLMTLGIGAALLATSMRQHALAALAWSAVLLHVWNHAIAKGLLFLSAGAMAEVAGSRDLERWGGLLRRLPLLGTTLMIGAAALIGLPGTHTFASEWLLLLALFRGCQAFAGPQRLAMLIAVVAVTFTAGAALACFVRLIGVGLLGHPRSREAAECVAPRSAGLRLTTAALAFLCLALVAFLQPMLGLLSHAVAELVPRGFSTEARRVASPLPWLALVPVAAGILFAIYRAWLRGTRGVRSTVTWDCGYARPDVSMQYSASSLPQPVTRVLQPALKTMTSWTAPRGLWPSEMKWEARTPERALAELYRPGYLRLTSLLGSLSRLQEGRVMVYLRYVGLALLVLLAWFFWPTEAPR
jgi:hydrogenase-4 component B